MPMSAEQAGFIGAPFLCFRDLARCTPPDRRDRRRYELISADSGARDVARLARVSRVSPIYLRNMA
jgi:hypothetical protein